MAQHQPQIISRRNVPVVCNAAVSDGGSIRHLIQLPSSSRVCLRDRYREISLATSIGVGICITRGGCALPATEREKEKRRRHEQGEPLAARLLLLDRSTHRRTRPRSRFCRETATLPRDPSTLAEPLPAIVVTAPLWSDVPISTQSFGIGLPTASDLAASR